MTVGRSTSLLRQVSTSECVSLKALVAGDEAHYMTAFHLRSGGQGQYGDVSSQSLASDRAASESFDSARFTLDQAPLERPGRGVPPPRSGPPLGAP